MELNVEEIMEILPHRYPMLLVDKIIEMVPMDYAIGVKCVTMNEPCFPGHFPGHPVMPLHSSRFTVDEDALYYGILMKAALALDYLSL